VPFRNRASCSLGRVRCRRQRVSRSRGWRQSEARRGNMSPTTSARLGARSRSSVSCERVRAEEEGRDSIDLYSVTLSGIDQSPLRRPASTCATGTAAVAAAAAPRASSSCPRRRVSSRGARGRGHRRHPSRRAENLDTIKRAARDPEIRQRFGLLKARRNEYFARYREVSRAGSGTAFAIRVVGGECFGLVTVELVARAQCISRCCRATSTSAPVALRPLRPSAASGGDEQHRVRATSFQSE
jgi:hypothetical protein